MFDYSESAPRDGQVWLPNLPGACILREKYEDVPALEME
jgi:hypothetical protein